MIKPVTPYSRRSNLGQGIEHVFSHVEAPTNSPAPATAPELNKKMKSKIPSLKQPPPPLDNISPLFFLHKLCLQFTQCRNLSPSLSLFFLSSLLTWESLPSLIITHSSFLFPCIIKSSFPLILLNKNRIEFNSIQCWKQIPLPKRFSESVSFSLVSIPSTNPRFFLPLSLSLKLWLLLLID